MNTLGYAILGLMADRPRTGYEVSRAMERPLGYFWSARHSQIYPQLAELEAAGLLRGRVIPGPGPRDTKRYTLTRQGRSVLITWLAGPLTHEPTKSELMLRVWSLWLLTPDQAGQLVAAVRAETLEALDKAGLEQQGFSTGVASTHLADPEFGRWATLQWGIGQREATLRWCDWLLGRLTEPAGGASPPA
jgi:DNA-binding PadR family transcriptional regulator